MKEKKKIIIVSVIGVALIILVVLLIIKFVNLSKNKENVQTFNNENEIDNNIINNEIENTNEITENKQNQNTSIKNTNTNTVIVDNEQEIDRQTMQNKEDNEQKAIKIAKEDWGEDNTVYFTFDSIDSNGKYLVCVRNNATTEALNWYTIDLETGTFTIE